MIKQKFVAILQLCWLLFNGFAIGMYGILFLNYKVIDIVIQQKRIKVKKKVSQKDLKEYLNECYKNSR